MSTQRPLIAWEFSDVSERDNTGSNDGLVLGATCYVHSTTAYYYASAVAATSSTWTAVTAGAGATLAATLALGNTTGGTGLVVSAGDPLTLNETPSVPGGAPSAGEGKLWVRDDAPNVLVFTDDAGTDFVLSSGGSGDVIGPAGATGDAIARFDNTTGKLIQNSVGILSDTGDLSGINDITLSGTVDGRDIAADGSALDAHIADTTNPHSTTLALALSSGSTTGGTEIEVSAGDPVTFNENASVPGGAPAAGKGKLWVRNDTPNKLYFTNDAGVDIDLISGGSIPTLSQVLGSGDTTGSNDIVFNSTGILSFSNSSTTFDDTSGTFTLASTGADVLVDTSAGVGNISLTPGGSLVLDYSTWPAADGSAGQALVTDGAGGLSWGASTLANVLSSGNTTGGTDFEVSAGDGFVLNENASDPFVTAAGKGSLWVRNDSPNVLVFTDDAGTDYTIGGAGVGGLASTLALGNTTGGNDIVLSSGDLLTTPDVSSTTAGVGLNIQPGDALGSGNGGTVTINGGSSATGSRAGDVNLRAGEGAVAGTDAGRVQLYGGVIRATGTGSQGSITLTGGESKLSSTAAGEILISGGYIVDAAVDANGGKATFKGGDVLASGSIGNGGEVYIDGGDGGSGGGTGGAIFITAGAAQTGNHTGAQVSVSAGDASGTNAGGAVTLTAGDADTTGNGGAVELRSGDGGSSSGLGGTIALIPGADASGVQGTISLQSLKTSVNRVYYNQGTNLVTGDFALSAGWGSTASITTLSGKDSRFSLEITSAGTGQAANPTLTLTFTDGAWPVVPFPLVQDNGSVTSGGSYLGPVWELTAVSTTAATWTLRSATGVSPGGGTPYVPVAGDIFKIIVLVMG